MSAKIAKTLARQKEKVAEGQFYEAHQQLRVITSRYIKSSDYESAASVLHNGSLLLLRAGQGGSGGDLARMLVDEVYIKGNQPVTDETRRRAIEILKAFPPDEPTRKRFVTELMTWSGKHGAVETGDPTLHHEIGALFAAESDPYPAEMHLLLGLPQASPPVLARLHVQWYQIDNPHTAPLYASRSVLPYLSLGNLASATLAFQSFTSALLSPPSPSSPSPPPTQTIESSKSSARIFPSLPLLNFLSLLLLACQKGDATLFKLLTKHYAAHLRDIEALWGEHLAIIGEVWFGIRIPRQAGNPLFDMMGSMLFGGGAGNQGGGGRGASKPGQKQVSGTAVEKPVAMDLD